MTTREQLLEKRCERFKKIILDEWFNRSLSAPEYLSYLVKEGFLSFNDSRYLLGLCELPDFLDEYESQLEKPPLGVMPRHIWDRKRQTELAEAMQRYLEAGKHIPKEWIDEYNELCTED